MTGTRKTEAPEFSEDLQPRRDRDPDQPADLTGIEEPDLVYRNRREKYDAIVTDILEKQASGPSDAWSAPCRSRNQSGLSGAAAQARHQALSC
jgi:hypothetical protein